MSVGSVSCERTHVWAAFVPLLFISVLGIHRNRPSAVAARFFWISLLKERTKEKVATKSGTCLRVSTELLSPQSCSPVSGGRCWETPGPPSRSVAIFAFLNSWGKDQVFTVTLIGLWSVNKYLNTWYVVSIAVQIKTQISLAASECFHYSPFSAWQPKWSLKSMN